MVNALTAHTVLEHVMQLELCYDTDYRLRVLLGQQII